MEFRDDYKLINSRPDERNCENSFLFTVEHFFLNKNLEDYRILQLAVFRMRIGEGIFLQNPSGELVGADAFMSHDQLTALVAFSYYTNIGFHKEVWKEIKRQWFRYNNIDVPKTFFQKLVNKRFLHPSDVIFYGYCAGSLVCKLLLPLLMLTMLISSVKKYKKRGDKVFIHTDGKLLNFVRIKSCMEKSFIWKLKWKLHTFIMKKKFGSWNKVFNIYFPFDNHPNVIASKDI